MIRLLQGDAAEMLETLDAESVRCCITSPPYWGLRDYGTGEWISGDSSCDHLAPLPGGTESSGLSQYPNTLDDSDIVAKVERVRQQYRDICPLCGAIRIDTQIGLEPTPERYVSKLVDVFRRVRRVLSDDGTLWVNIGDSYASDTKGSGGPSDKQLSNAGSRYDSGRRLRHGVKPKDLVGIPWSLAFALRDDGWFLRCDVIWSKPNPMPESVTDRPTKAHEYLFLLAKSDRYYFDADAIAEISLYPGDNRAQRADTRKQVDPMCQDNGSRARTGNPTLEFRNRRSVWTIPTQPFPGAHFAAMPEDLVVPCILAGSQNDDWILDPFCGSGTVGEVALKQGRSFVGIDLNAEYIEIARARIYSGAPLFYSESPS